MLCKCGPEYGDGLFLAEAPGALTRLDVRGGVPVGVKEQDAVSAREVDADAADARGEEEEEDGGVAIEVVDHAEALRHRHGAVHAVIREARVANVALNDVEHLLRLREEQRLVALLPPLAQHLPAAATRQRSQRSSEKRDMQHRGARLHGDLQLGAALEGAVVDVGVRGELHTV